MMSEEFAHKILLEMQRDIKTLLTDVCILKYKAGLYGMIGSAIFLIVTFLAKKMGVL
jgi:hypothetical protein